MDLSFSLIEDPSLLGGGNGGAYSPTIRMLYEEARVSSKVGTMEKLQASQAMDRSFRILRIW